MALCGIVSNAFEMSNCTSVRRTRDLASRMSWLSSCMLLKHPGSDTKPFCRGDSVVAFLSLWSKIPQYIRHRSELIVSGRKCSMVFGSFPGFGINMALFCFQLVGCLWAMKMRLKNSLRASFVSFLLMSDFTIPSGPGALPFFILLRRALISLLVMAFIISSDTSISLLVCWNGMAIAGLSPQCCIIGLNICVVE
jgi:hypothetical protein